MKTRRKLLRQSHKTNTTHLFFQNQSSSSENFVKPPNPIALNRAADITVSTQGIVIIGVSVLGFLISVVYCVFIGEMDHNGRRRRKVKRLNNELSQQRQSMTDVGQTARLSRVSFGAKNLHFEYSVADSISTSLGDAANGSPTAPPHVVSTSSGKDASSVETASTPSVSEVRPKSVLKRNSTTSVR